MINWVVIGWTILRTLGTVLGSILMTLLTGRAFKRLLMWPVEWWVSRHPGSAKEEQILEDAEHDLGLDTQNRK